MFVAVPKEIPTKDLPSNELHTKKIVIKVVE